MIVDKHPSSTPEASFEEQPVQKTRVQELVETNPMVEAYKAVKTILSELKKDPNDPDSPPLFYTIKLDNGQLARLKKTRLNEEYGVVFPAVFIHFINVYYTIGAARIAEGKGVMRIHYVLNRLNNSDDVMEEEGLHVYKQIVEAIERNKYRFPALINRFQLAYWDQPLSFDDGLQPYWIDYQIWFNDFTSYAYKDYVQTYITHPPFTQPSDQNEIANPDHIPDYEEPTFDEASGIAETSS